MSNMQRVTLTLPTDVLTQAREMSQGNLSQYVANLLREHFESERRRLLREALIAGAIANAEEDLRIAEEFRYADYEVTLKYVPPSPELELEDANELSSTR
jgi:Post-segregation antitoxin CcdA